MKESVSIAHHVLGSVPKHEFCKRLYGMMQEVKDMIKEVEAERNEE